MRSSKKTISIFLVLVMMFSLFPTSAFATDDGLDAEVESEQAQEQEPIVTIEEQPAKEEPVQEEAAQTPADAEDLNSEPDAEEEFEYEQTQNADAALAAAEEDSSVVDSGTCGNNLTWTLDNNGVLTITGEGAMANYDSVPDRRAPWYSYREEITSVLLPEELETIGSYGFYQCTNFDSITIPSGVTSIGASAFENCFALEYITFKGSAPTISGNYVFSYVTATARYISDETWTSSVRQNYGGSITWIDEQGKVDYGTCGDNITWTLYESGLLTIDGTGEMYDYSYSSSPWYTYIDLILEAKISDGITSIGSYAFVDCTGLESIVLPESVTSIGSYAFEDCTGLESIVLPESITSIGSYAFSGCEQLKEIHFAGNKAPTLDYPAFQNVNAIAYFPICNNSWASAINSSTGGPIEWRLEGTNSYDETIQALLNATYTGTSTVTIYVEKDVTIEGNVTIASNVGLWIYDGHTVTINGNLTQSGHLYSSSDKVGSNLIITGGYTINSYYTQYHNIHVSAKAVALNDSFYISNGTLTTETLKLGSYGSITLGGGRLDVTNTYSGNGKKISVDNSNYEDFHDAVSDNLLQYVSLSGVKVNTGEELAEAVNLPVAKVSISTGADIVLTGDLTIGSNASISVTGTTNALDDEITGSLTVPAGCTLINNGSITLNSGGIKILSGGTFVNNGTITVSYSGSDATLVAEDGANISYGSNASVPIYSFQNFSASSLAVAFRLGHKGLYISDCDYVIDVDIEVPASGSVYIYNSTVTIAENAKLTIKCNNVELYGNSTLIVNGKYNGPDVFVDNGSQILPQSKIASKKDYTNYSYVTIGQTKATAIDVTDSKGASVTNSTIAVDMTEQGTYQLGIATTPADASQRVTWKSSSTAVATVDSDGLVTFLKPGTVTITVTTKDGGNKSAKVTFSVYYKDTAKTFTAALDSTSNKYNQPTSLGLQLGDSVQLFIYGTDKTTALNGADFSYTVNNSFVTVDENGTITAKKSGGTSTVTAVLKGDPSNRKISVTVKTIAVQVGSVVIVPATESAAFVGLDLNGQTAENGVEVVGYQLNTDKSKSVQSFAIKALAYDMLGEPIENTKGLFTWASTAGGVATVKESADGTVTITIPANGDGACAVTATAKDVLKNSGSMSVYVMDYTPRLESSSLTIDTQKVGEASLALVESYGNTINKVEFKSYNSKTKTYETNDNFIFTYDNNMLTVNSTSLLSNQTIKGQLVITTDRGEYTLNLNLVVKNSTPSVTVKQSSKFNLFYLDSTADLTVNVNGVSVGQISDIELVGNSFVSKSYDNDGKITIVYGNTDSKLSTSGTLKITVDGYANPIEKAVNIATVTTKPKLSLQPASAVLNTKLGVTSVTTSIYNADTKAYIDASALALSISAGAAELTTSGEQLMLSCVEGSKGGKVTITAQAENWVSPITLSFNMTVNDKLPTVKLSKSTLTVNTQYTNSYDSASLTLSQNNLSPDSISAVELSPAKASAETDKLSVYYEDGQIIASVLDSSVKAGSYVYSFVPEYNYNGESANLTTVKVTVKVVNTAPTGKLSSGTISLNNVLTDSVATFTVIPSDKNLEITNVDVKTRLAATASGYAEANKIDFSFDSESRTVTGKIRDGETPKTGSYSYNVVATCASEQGNVELKALTLTVKVVNTLPKVKLSASSLNLNSSVAGMETGSIAITSLTSGYTVLDCAVERLDTNANLLAQSNRIDVSTTENSIVASLSSSNVTANGNYKFRVTPVVQDDTTGQTVTLSPLSFTVRVYTNKNYSATVSASGSLNVLNRSTGITYTVTKLNNIIGTVSSAELIGDSAELFELSSVEFNTKGQPTVELKLKDDASYATNVTYKVQLKFTLESGAAVSSPVQSIKVTQPGIKATATPTTRTVYQSQSPSRTITYTIALTSPTGAKIGSARVDTVTALQNAVESISADVNADGTVTVTVKLKDTGKLVANKSYTIPVTITPANQASNMNTTTKVNLTLKTMK